MGKKDFGWDDCGCLVFGIKCSYGTGAFFAIHTLSFLRLPLIFLAVGGGTLGENAIPEYDQERTIGLGKLYIRYSIAATLGVFFFG